MSLIEDDARRLAEQYPEAEGARHGECWYCQAAPHAPDCPCLSMPRIVAALEMVEPMMAAVERMGRHHQTYRETPMGPHAPPGSPPTYKTCDHYCSSWPCVEHEAYQAVAAFVAALRGEVVPST